MEEALKLYLADMIGAIIEKEEQGQLCPQTLDRLKKDLYDLGEDEKYIKEEM